MSDENKILKFIFADESVMIVPVKYAMQMKIIHDMFSDLPPSNEAIYVPCFITRELFQQALAKKNNADTIDKVYNFLYEIEPITFTKIITHNDIKRYSNLSPYGNCHITLHELIGKTITNVTISYVSSNHSDAPVINYGNINIDVKCYKNNVDSIIKCASNGDEMFIKQYHHINFTLKFEFDYIC